MKTTALLLLSALALAAGCDRSAEVDTREVERAAGEAGRQIEHAAEKTAEGAKEAAGQAGDAIKDATAEVKEEVGGGRARADSARPDSVRR